MRSGVMAVPRDHRLFRLLPGSTPVHRLWAGTKLLALAAVCLVLSVRPTWQAEAVVGALLLVAFAVARVPRRALPAPGPAAWLVVAVLVALSLTADGLLVVLRFALLTALVVGAAALVGWTTSPGELAPALAQLGAPLRRLRLPVAEWCATIALGVRSLPLIADEVQTLRAAGRLRPAPRAESWRARLRRPVDLLVTAVVVSTLRADELGDAMAARGGPGYAGAATTEKARIAGRDVAALVLVGVTVVLAAAA
jgi:energy-coupling factor transport system permease protein